MERADVQGLLLYAYKQHPRSRFYLLDLGRGEPREWLRRVLTDVTSGEEDKDGRYRFNLAFSARGLAALGLDEQDLATFQREFVQGMAHPERSHVLGDHYSDDPEHWQWGNQASPVGAVAMLYARSDEELEARDAELAKLLEKYGIAYRREDVSMTPDGREHFGFADGLAQPFVRGSGRTRGPGDEKLATGEFVLGYKNAYGQVTSVPSARRRGGTRELPFPVPGEPERMSFGHNGTYLVIRKLQQDVAGFWQYCWDAALAEQPPNVAERAKLIAARMVGRWPNGVPLVDAPEAERPPAAGLNDFRFRDRDPDGLRCPFGSHVRRAYPRDMFGDTAKEGLHDSNLHRILRRGRVYGPKLPGSMPRTDDGVERGLFFIALNANLRRQFEFIQQTWINSCKFAGLSVERDPLVGKEALDFDDQPVPRVFTVQARPTRDRYEGLPKVVRVRGGEYFFLPGLRALNYLCEGSE
jgi:Dyp-type peroxidase family